MTFGLEHGKSVSVAATASSVDETIAMPDGYDGLHIANTSATLYVSVRWESDSAATAVLGTDLTLPPMGHMVVEANDTITIVAAIGSGAGPTPVVFTPVKLAAG